MIALPARVRAYTPRDSRNKCHFVVRDEYVVFYDPDSAPGPSGYAAIPECVWLRDPFVRDVDADRDRVIQYWMGVASGDIPLEEKIGCCWCKYAIPVKRDTRHPMLYNTILCGNREVTDGASSGGRNCGEVSGRCVPATHFVPRGVHAYAEGYFGWKPDPDVIARMERRARPPKSVVCDPDVVDDNSVDSTRRVWW